MPRTNALTQSIADFGSWIISIPVAIGAFTLFSIHATAFAFVEPFRVKGWQRFLPQAYAIGTKSVPVIMATGTFIGMVLVVQGWPQFENAGLQDRLGGIVNISVAAELGPVLAGVMLAGRVGGALTAELGTMNVTEQLLALRSMGCDPVRFLVTPRFLACLVLAPILTLYGNLMGALGAWMVYTMHYGGESEPFWFYTREIVEYWDLATGLVKAFCFGGAIGLISCYSGFNCGRGAEGVGKACTEAFVMSFITILALDFLLNIVINKLYEAIYGFRDLLI